MPVTTSGFSNHLAPGIRAIINLSLESRESYYSYYYNIETSQRNYEDWLMGAGLPIAGEKPQGVNIAAFDPLEGTTKRLSHKTYAIAMEVTEEAWEDDLYKTQGSAIRSGASGIADSLAERVEIEAHRPWTSEGFTTTFSVLPNTTATAFFATTHGPIAGGTGPVQANKPSTDVDLTVTSLRAAFTTMRKYKNDQGYRISMAATPSTLFVPPDLEYDAKEILRSNMRPDTANNVDNVTKNEVGIVVDPYLSDDADAWFIKAKKHYAVFLWRKRPVLDSFDDRRARVAIFTGRERFSYAPMHFLGWYGTTGA